VGILKIASLSPIPNLAAWIGAALVIILGAINIKDYFFYGRGFSLKISSRHWPIITKLIHKATIPSACLVGFLVAFFEFPCTGGIYIAILGMLASKTANLEALTYLSIYNFAFILPLIVILVFMSSSQIVEKMKKWQLEKKSYFKLFTGLTMIAIGILIFLWTL
jgi:cytochrome c biogenesis protein CcdA